MADDILFCLSCLLGSFFEQKPPVIISLRGSFSIPKIVGYIPLIICLNEAFNDGIKSGDGQLKLPSSLLYSTVVLLSESV